MPRFDVKVASDGYDCSISFPKVARNGVEVGGLDYAQRIKVGRAADSAWLKARRKDLDAALKGQLGHDIDQFERFCADLSSEKTLTARAKKEVAARKLDQKAALALVEELAEEAIAERWNRLCKVTFPTGLKSAFEKMIADEEKALKATLKSDMDIAGASFSKRPMISIAVTALSAIVGVGTTTNPLGAFLAGAIGIVSVLREGAKHKGEVEASLKALIKAEEALAEALKDAGKALEKAQTALDTMGKAQRIARNTAAAKTGDQLADVRKRLESYGVKDLGPAKARLDRDAAER